jgi:hypothetical protein
MFLGLRRTGRGWKYLQVFDELSMRQSCTWRFAFAFAFAFAHSPLPKVESTLMLNSSDFTWVTSNSKHRVASHWLDQLTSHTDRGEGFPSSAGVASHEPSATSVKPRKQGHQPYLKTLLTRNNNTLWRPLITVVVFSCGGVV